MLVNLFIFILGACIFSFLNVVAYRYPKGISFVKGYSFCPHCHHRLYPVDLIPIFSYFLLHGRCHYCHSHIDIKDTINEIIGGIVILHCFYHRDFIILFVFFCLLDILSLIDVDTYDVYDIFLYCLIGLVVISLFLFDMSVIDRILGGFLISLSMVLINFIIKDSFGGGDIKLIFMNGLFLGTKYIIIATYISFMLGGFYAFYLIIHKSKGLRDHFAFVPFLSTGMFIAVFYSDILIKMIS